jgi:preprotein translocase subunit SecD
MNLKKNWRIAFLVFWVVLALLLVGTKGLSFGIDFTGGTELKLELEDEASEEEVNTIVSILKNRLNGLGLKSTQVLKEADNQHITVKVSTTDTAELSNVKNIINRQAIFEQYVEGELVARGDEIQLDIGNQGGAVQTTGRKWRVYVKVTGEAPERAGEIMEGKAGHMTDVFLDRPRDAFILMESDRCTALASETFKNHEDDTGYTMLSFIEERANIPVLCYSAEVRDDGVNETLLEDLGLEIENETGEEVFSLNETVSEMQELYDDGQTDIILPVNQSELPRELRQKVWELNTTVIIHEKGEDQPYHLNPDPTGDRPDNSDSWIDIVTGLKSTLRIGEGLTYGTPVYSSVFEGGAGTAEEASAIADRYKIWLTSGNLPIKTDIILERPNLPELGQQFLKFAGIIALIALGLVASVISFRYREPKISMAILTTSFSEIIMIMGFASAVSWELDLAAMAGIIAAIGTGVDHQIIITDETLRGERKTKEDKKIWDVKQSLNRAFFIILASAITTITAMLPLMSIIDLRGFAFTSIIGILIGILISRPAYGRLVELIT